MPLTPTTNAATIACNRMIADPTLGQKDRSLVMKVHEFVESYRSDGHYSSFYEDCIRELMGELALVAVSPEPTFKAPAIG